ncbi:MULTISPECIES: M16 family metallopeptidase [Pseudomonas]|jgi:zinc protease|uniref:M16 family metallopeptidase n=1 Tax=Pseudomonas TaxID=286 RepID=UPI0018CA6E9B|nr:MULTISPECIES: pitrilysin family protein [unclassified Pseudomonas]MBM7398844.1 zinc protease [Pseudomonas sp. M5]QPN45819.1 insulinase family protein [Priestia aryabhattai]GLH34969.1 peptidase M16 [Pseudomonas sp. BR1R-5]HDS1758361.1 insulinase family protein [Pseudomonas putida]
MPSTPPFTLDDQTVSAGIDSIADATPTSLQHFTLDNGLAVYLREDHSTPLAAIQLWYHVGTSHEPAGHTNLSHLLEHLIFEGSRKLEAGRYTQVIARLGGKANATTTDDATAYDVLLPAARLPIALEIMADAMAGATFGQADMERAVKAIEDERRLKVENAPAQQAAERHIALAHGSSPYATAAFGNPADLNNMRLDTVRTWYQTWYRPNNATLVVVGAVDLPTLRQHVSRYFASIARAPLGAAPVPRHDAHLQERSQKLKLPGLRDGLFMSFNAPSHATATEATTVPALGVLCEVLGKGFSARLYSELVRDRRLLKGIGLSYEPMVRGDTLLTLSTYINSQRSTHEHAVEAIYTLIDTLRHTLLSPQELERAKLRMLTRRLFSRDSVTLQAGRIGAAAAAGLSPSLIDQEAERVRHLDSATLRQVAFDYLSRERLTITHLQTGAPA